ncbi:hypothetical protein [Paracoccus denitrificans]|uniref:hypothetical protein n=1 Tax=Paracoccus denitrificans TaxID=266 RepID=UPI003364B974
MADPMDDAMRLFEQQGLPARVWAMEQILVNLLAELADSNRQVRLGLEAQVSATNHELASLERSEGKNLRVTTELIGMNRVLMMLQEVSSRLDKPLRQQAILTPVPKASPPERS